MLKKFKSESLVRLTVTSDDVISIIDTFMDFLTKESIVWDWDDEMGQYPGVITATFFVSLDDISKVEAWLKEHGAEQELQTPKVTGKFGPMGNMQGKDHPFRR